MSLAAVFSASRWVCRAAFGFGDSAVQGSQRSTTFRRNFATNLLPPIERLLAVRQVAAQFGVSTATVYKWAADATHQPRRDIDQKRRATAYLHARPLLLGRVDEIQEVAPATVSLAGEPG